MQSTMQGRTYVQNSSGIWTPVGMGAGATSMPTHQTSPNVSALGMYQYVNPYGTARVSTEPTPIFFDPFDGAAFDTNRWTTAGTAPTVSGGSANFGIGTTASATSSMVSVPSFLSPGLGFTPMGFVITLETAQVTNPNAHRFWGRGVVTSYAYATPLTNGYGFEVDGTGALNAVVYASGTRYVLNSTNAALVSTSTGLAGAAGAALPTGTTGTAYGAALTWQGNSHRYLVVARTDAIYWYVEGVERPVAAIQYPPVPVQTLPVRIAQANNSAGVLATSFSVSGVGVSDSTASNVGITDGTYPWREAQVDAAGALRVRDTLEASRVAIMASCTPSGTSAANTETGLSLQLARGTNTAAALASSQAITAGKTLRLTSLTLVMTGATTGTASTGQFSLRFNISGAITTTSPLLGQWNLSVPATGTVSTVMTIALPDGYDITNSSGTTQWGLTIRSSVAVTNAPSFTANVVGYEY